MVFFNTYAAIPEHTTFLYPKSRQYPIDEVCEKIVKALERKKWKVPGIQVTFFNSGKGEEKYRQVYEIKGENFKLHFGRIQGQINSLKNDTAAIGQVTIPQKELHIYGDESGPTYYTYQGNNWEKDKEHFISGGWTFHDQPSHILEYSGNSRYVGLRSPCLFKKRGMEGPDFYETQKVFEEINTWLNENVLPIIESQENQNVELTTEPEIPYPENVGPFYVKIDKETYNRILIGKKDKDQLEPSKRYALLATGRRLVNLHVPQDDTFPEEAYEGFQYCTLKKPDFGKDDSFEAILRIHPKNGNEIFVADFAPGKKYRQQCFATNTEKSLTNEQVDEYQRRLARTLVPCHLYKGDYEDPLILIKYGKELSFDEVEIVDVRNT